MPYTLADRDRTILMDGKINTLEAKIDALETKMDVQFESQQRQLDDLKTLFYWGFGIMVSLFMFMFGYIIWDRRTAMKPALQQASEAKDKNTTLTTVIREYSKTHPDLAEILKTHGLL